MSSSSQIRGVCEAVVSLSEKGCGLVWALLGQLSFSASGWEEGFDAS